MKMGPYAISPIIVSLMDQPVQMVEVFTFPIKRSVQLSQTSVPRRYPLVQKSIALQRKIPRKSRNYTGFLDCLTKPS